MGVGARPLPHLLNPTLTITNAAATRPVLKATAISLGIGAVLLVPSLTRLYILFQRSNKETAASNTS